MDNQNDNFRQVKDIARSWLWCVGVLFMCGMLLSLLTNPNEYKIDDLDEKIPDQALIVFDVLKRKALVPQDTLDAIAALQPEWEEKKRAKDGAWAAIGPGGKIKDAGSTTSKGRDWYKKLDEFKDVDRKMTGIKHQGVREHGDKLSGTDAARHWDTYTYLKKEKQRRIDSRRWYEKGGWGEVHIILQTLLRITCIITFFGSVCLTFILIFEFLEAVN